MKAATSGDDVSVSVSCVSDRSSNLAASGTMVMATTPDQAGSQHVATTWAAVIVGVSPDPADGPTISAWCNDYWEAVHPYSAGGAYVNFMMDEGAGRVAASYRGNYPRLVAVKKRYDRGNVFRVNQNIGPG